MFQSTTEKEEPQFIILSEKDLFDYRLKDNKICQGYTVKGTRCKKKVSGHNHSYCNIHKQKYKFEKPDECPVCMESLNDVKSPISCSHWIHRKCILNWGKPNCPVCRTEIKLSTSEKRKLRLKNRNSDNSNDNTILQFNGENRQIVLPTRIVNIINSIVAAFPTLVQEGIEIQLNIDDERIDDNIESDIDIQGYFYNNHLQDHLYIIQQENGSYTYENGTNLFSDDNDYENEFMMNSSEIV